MINVNGVKIKTPQKLSVGIYDVSKSADRNAEGTILIDRVAVKRKLEMEWGALTNAEISALLSAVTSVFFSVTYPDPQTGGSKTITCYVGDRSIPMLMYRGGVPMWEGLKMNFIEQ
ncbi:MAG: DUF6711 family protein [Christensenellales bacterium]|jgi:hypothetical protein